MRKLLSMALLVVLIGSSLGQEAQPRATLQADSHVTLAVAFSPDGLLLATGGGDGKAKLWDVATGKLRATRKGHEGPRLATLLRAVSKTPTLRNVRKTAPTESCCAAQT
jgi:WD40 repeat protein